MRQLKDIFRRALQVSMPVALAGCGPDVGGYAEAACEGGRIAISNLTPSVIPDVVELRSVNRSDGRSDDTQSTVASHGTACKSASNVETCKSTFAALLPSSGFANSCFQLCSDYYLATTRGDEVTAWSSLESLNSFLGIIDTGQEAVLLALANGYNVSCGDVTRGAYKRTKAGFDVIATKGFACGTGSNLTRHYLSVSSEGVVTEVRNEVVEYGDPNCAVGRRPNGLISRGENACSDALGRFFGEIAHLEAASVTAFDQLGDELEAANAPASLVEAARLSAREEVTHAELTSAIARRFGGVPNGPRVEARASRSLFELALDNAVEGCVRETFGALVAHHQALTAGDASIRSAMHTIAADETSHAELSWHIDAWAREQLSPAQYERVQSARRSALEVLRHALATESLDEVVRVEAGMPSPSVSLSLLASLEADLFALHA